MLSVGMATPQPPRRRNSGYRLLPLVAALAAWPLSCAAGDKLPAPAASPTTAPWPLRPASPLPQPTGSATPAPLPTGSAPDAAAAPAASSAPSAVPPPRLAQVSPVYRQLEQVDADLQAGRTDKAQTRLAQMLGAVDRGGPLDERIAAHALMGRVYQRKALPGQAASEYAKVRALWGNSSDAVQHIGSPDEPQPVRYARLGRALDGVGEAFFYAAEQRRLQTVERLRFPEYHGAGQAHPPAKPLQDMSPAERDRELARRKAESDAVRRHIDGPVRHWMVDKQRAVEEAEKEYARLLDLQPVPPPRWVLASAARVGRMWADFAADLDKAPVPGWMRDDPELLNAYRQLLESAAEPLIQRARSAFETCHNLADRYHIDNEFSAACATWLDAHP